MADNLAPFSQFCKAILAQSAFLGRCSPVRVVRIEPYGKDSRLAILTDGTRLLVSRAGYARLKSLLDERK